LQEKGASIGLLTPLFFYELFKRFQSFCKGQVYIK
jgi:hypothetical protein